MNYQAPNWRVGLSISFVLALQAVGDAAQPEAIPSVPEKRRYEALRTHCPFSVAAAPTGTLAPPASFAANWFVSGIGRIGSSDFVTIASRDLSAAFRLYAQETDPKTGVTLASIGWSATVGKSIVIVRKGTETARLEFNEAQLRAAPTVPNAAAPAAPPLPNRIAPINGRPGVNPGIARPRTPASTIVEPVFSPITNRPIPPPATPIYSAAVGRAKVRRKEALLQARRTSNPGSITLPVSLDLMSLTVADR